MPFFLLVVGLVVVGGAALLASGRADGLAPAGHDRDRPALLDDPRPLDADDLDRLTSGPVFAVAWRGYRMDDVDAVVDRLVAEVAARDERIAELELERDGGQRVGADPGARVTAPGIELPPAAAQGRGGAHRVGRSRRG